MKFKVGDRVRVTTSGKTGEVLATYDGYDWNLNGNSEYTILFDNGEGQLNIVEKVLELEDEKTCECGTKFIKWFGNNHSRWCKLYQKD